MSETPYVRLTTQAYYDLLVQSAQDGTMPSMQNSCCKYRYVDPEGIVHRCAIGIVFDDAVYNEIVAPAIQDMNGDGGQEDNASANIDDLLKSTPILKSIVPLGVGYALQEIQKCHDDVANDVPYTCFYNASFAQRFMRLINDLPCFASITRVDYNELP